MSGIKLPLSIQPSRISLKDETAAMKRSYARRCREIDRMADARVATIHFCAGLFAVVTFWIATAAVGALGDDPWRFAWTTVGGGPFACVGLIVMVKQRRKLRELNESVDSEVSR